MSKTIAAATLEAESQLRQLNHQNFAWVADAQAALEKFQATLTLTRPREHNRKDGLGLSAAARWDKYDNCIWLAYFRVDTLH